MRYLFRPALSVSIFAVIVAAIHYTPSRADDRADGQEKRLTVMKERLQLTDGQVNEIRAILETARLEADRDREKFREARDPEAGHKAMEARRKITQDKIRAVLNDKQRKELDKMKDELGPRKDRRGDKPGGSRGGDRGGRRGMGR